MTKRRGFCNICWYMYINFGSVVTFVTPVCFKTGTVKPRAKLRHRVITKWKQKTNTGEILIRVWNAEYQINSLAQLSLGAITKYSREIPIKTFHPQNSTGSETSKIPPSSPYGRVIAPHIPRMSYRRVLVPTSDGMSLRYRR